ncbi:hypothetical protein SPBR_01305 [Sporothrix brasiliensis 5110]|uniref:VTC domain-containing protein n=1 Tax=Sporothrix brasiliensis 5110 TaxID=1398154 RepID=A0A0C2IXX7_9PEZI|nr:uncharacterized protein SPBR_01305 [Sporothrix brasiliensis 5110]KIH91590.1 hypothetical protein SPBR_01305 [Sporothrix brasiliensis 5110]
MNTTKDAKQEKRGFWSNLFRSRSSKGKNAKLEKNHPKKTTGDSPDGDVHVPATRRTPPGLRRPGPTQVRQPGPIPVQEQQPARYQKEKVSAPANGGNQAAVYQYPDRAMSKSAGGTKRAKGKASPAPKSNGTSYSSVPVSPLTEWPPNNIPADTELPLGGAIEYISRGAPVYSGFRKDVPHMSDQYFTLYSTSTGNQKTSGASRSGRHSRDGDRDRDRGRGDRRGERDVDRNNSNNGDISTDGIDLHNSMTQFMTMRINQGPGSSASSSQTPLSPWDTLEQPSFAFCFGRRPGTITLNHWAGLSGSLPPTIALRDSGVRPRDVNLTQICQRLRDIQLNGLCEDDEDRLYRNLYRRLLRDPDRMFGPHRTLDKQITDLILVLSRPDYWIDFTVPRNQVATRFIFDTGHSNHEQYQRFFHQLLLSIELDLRISSRHHSDWAKEKLLQQLPPSLQWDLALARRWQDNIRVDAYGKSADQVKLRLKLKNRQVRMFKRFAGMMKWPNYAATVANLKQRDADGSLTSISSHAMAFFSGLVLPGPTFPFTIMNALIDVDPDQATDDLSLLTHLHPNCGFQYRNSYTYWTSTCIVGKVLAPTCRELAGWIGPARPTVDLGRSQIARIRTRRPRQDLSPDDALTMAERSDPLGPPAEVFPVKEYNLVSADSSDVVDTVRIELLTLRPAATPGPSTGASPASAGSGSLPPPSTAGTPVPGSSTAPRWFDASVQFAIDGISWPMRLNYDVSFVCAWPCSNKPHPLFFDYVYDVVKADEIVNVHDWATPCPSPGTAAATAHSAHARNQTVPPTVRFGGAGIPGPRYPSVSKDGDDEKVLVVEAFGVPDNEVLARAWCSHWGLSAIVADVKETCLACAIREAYAATITVVILVEGQPAYGDD